MNHVHIGLTRKFEFIYRPVHILVDLPILNKAPLNAGLSWQVEVLHDSKPQTSTLILDTMAKAKARQPSKPNAPNPHIYARINFLYQSAQLLSYNQVSDTTATATTTTHPHPSSPGTGPSSANTSLSRFYLSNARAVAKKSVLRISPAVKRTICKRCDALLIPGATSTHSIVNDSRNGRKPWADVLVVECNGCGAVKRFPIGMETRKKDWKLWSERPDVVIGGEAKNNRGDQEQQQKQGTAMEIDTTEGLVPRKAEEPHSKGTVDVTEDVARIHDHGTAA